MSLMERMKKSVPKYVVDGKNEKECAQNRPLEYSREDGVGLDMRLATFTACVCPLRHELNQEYRLGVHIG